MVRQIFEVIMLVFLKMLQTIVHYSLHLLAPALLARLLFRKRWKTAWGIMLVTMLVDLDHLLADPIFDPNRCGIGFHPLHTLPAMAVYALILCIPNSYVRMVAVGLLFHMATDLQDCLWIWLLG